MSFKTYVCCMVCEKEKHIENEKDHLPMGWKVVDRGHICSSACLLKFAQKQVAEDELSERRKAHLQEMPR